MYLRILCVTVLLFLFAALPATAQQYIGAIGGASVSNLDVSDAEDEMNTRTGFGVGGLFQVGMGQNVALRFEPMYVQKGAEQDLSEQTGVENAQARFNLSYLEVPVFFKINIPAGNLQPYALAGPTIGFNLNSELELETETVSATAAIEGPTRTIDAGLGFGGGLNVPIGGQSFFVEGRYIFGLVDIIDDRTVAVGDQQADVGGEVRNRGWQFMGGLMIPLEGGYR